MWDYGFVSHFHFIREHNLYFWSPSFWCFSLPKLCLCNPGIWSILLNLHNLWTLRRFSGQFLKAEICSQAQAQRQHCSSGCYPHSCEKSRPAEPLSGFFVQVPLARIRSYWFGRISRSGRGMRRNKNQLGVIALFRRFSSIYTPIVRLRCIFHSFPV